MPYSPERVILAQKPYTEEQKKRATTIINRKGQDNVFAVAHLIGLSKDFEYEDFIRFCENVPDGQKLYDDYNKYRTQSGKEQDYEFLDYANAILALHPNRDQV